MKQKLIPILDNGHGQETPGKRSPVWKDGTQLFEYEFNRDIVKRIVQKLKCAGIEHKILVPELTDVTLGERCRRANKMHKDSGNKCFLISVHANAGGGTGFEVFTSVGTTKADAMATIMFKEMEKEFDGWKMRADYSDGDPDKESQFYILKNTNCPAMLTENFFMDTEKDCRLIMSDCGRERIAEAHFKAILKIIE